METLVRTHAIGPLSIPSLNDQSGNRQHNRNAENTNLYFLLLHTYRTYVFISYSLTKIRIIRFVFNAIVYSNQVTVGMKGFRISADIISIFYL